MPNWVAPAALAFTGLAIAIVPLLHAYALVEDAWKGRPLRQRAVGVEADADAFQVFSEDWHSRLAWQHIEAFMETRDLLLLFSDADKSNLLLALPKRAITDPAHLADLRSLLRRERPVAGAFPVVEPRTP
jgi:hypothetical protein